MSQFLYFIFYKRICITEIFFVSLQRAVHSNILVFKSLTCLPEFLIVLNFICFGFFPLFSQFARGLSILLVFFQESPLGCIYHSLNLCVFKSMDFCFVLEKIYFSLLKIFCQFSYFLILKLTLFIFIFNNKSKLRALVISYKFSYVLFTFSLFSKWSLIVYFISPLTQ